MKDMCERTTERDIQELVDLQISENLQLDYKRCDALSKTDPKKKTELSKDVSSFANSAGGAVIYGVVESDLKPVKIDLGFDPDEISAEWIENVITSTVHPKVDGLRINPIPLASARNIYLVWVPQGNTAHQAHDKKYYKRHNFKSEPMEDYEVRDVMNRMKNPVLVPSFCGRRVDRTLSVKVRLKNKGGVRAKDYALEMTLPGAELVELGGAGLVHEAANDTQKVVVRNSHRGVAGPPIFPEDEVLLNDCGFDFWLKLRANWSKIRYESIKWRVFADNADPQVGEIQLQFLIP